MMARTDIEIFRIGSPVRIGKQIPAVVTGATLRAGGRVVHEVAWWDGNTHHSEWLESFLVEQQTDERDTNRIGFVG